MTSKRKDLPYPSLLKRLIAQTNGDEQKARHIYKRRVKEIEEELLKEEEKDESKSSSD
jgi:hypothetical protein